MTGWADDHVPLAAATSTYSLYTGTSVDRGGPLVALAYHTTR